MCGIAGILNQSSDEPITEGNLRQMLALIRHRGPDEFGIFLGDGVGLGSARLSILDLENGQQPICNEDGTLWIVYNGEIFNHADIRAELEARGHEFKTGTDTEVVLHAFEEYGPECLRRFNGQFAVAIWNTREHALFLARDRFGVRPLFYTMANGSLVFGSEIKAILASNRVTAAIDPISLNQVLTFWSTLSPRTIFKDIAELPPAHWMIADANGVRIQNWWQLDFCDATDAARNPSQREIEDRAEELRAMLTDAVRLRLRADVPVAAYLSGGLDSSVISALARDVVPDQLSTFSISFNDGEFDESEFQQRMAAHLGTRHEVVSVTHEEIGRVFPQVIWHSETPMLRTSPAPMFLLSQHVQERGFKVALTGEGADEMLGGYDIFKEARIRRFWAAQPESKRRKLLIKKLYPEIARFQKVGEEFLAAFFGNGLLDAESRFFSHAVRWRNGARLRRFVSDELAANVAPPVLPDCFERWDWLAQAQHLEISTFLAGYLLSSQGDRMSMAHAVEGRFPFLDFRVAEYCARLPSRLKLRVLKEKYLLRRMAAPFLPASILERRKRPYRAPIHRAFFHDRTESYVHELLSPAAVKQSGLFKPAAVAQLIRKIESGWEMGENDDMALAGILSTQLVHQQFVTGFDMPVPLSSRDNVKVSVARESCDRPKQPAYAF